MFKQVFFAHFQPEVMHFDPWKISNFFEKGPFWHQKWVKNRSKTQFSKIDRGPFGMLKQVRLAHFEPKMTHFALWKNPKYFENGPSWELKWVKNGSKMGHKHVFFAKVILDHSCSNNCF